jgi:hypothetical protein
LAQILLAIFLTDDSEVNPCFYNLQQAQRHSAGELGYGLSNLRG